MIPSSSRLSHRSGAFPSPRGPAGSERAASGRDRRRPSSTRRAGRSFMEPPSYLIDGGIVRRTSNLSKWGSSVGAQRQAAASLFVLYLQCLGGTMIAIDGADCTRAGCNH